MMSQEVQNGSDILSTPVEVDTTPVQSKDFIHKDKVTEIVRNNRREAEERGRQKAYEELKSQSSNHNYVVPDVRNLVSEEIQRHMSEFSQRAKEEQQTAIGQKMVNEFINKVVTSPNYEANREALDEVELQNIPKVIYLANQLDNTADIMFELAKNPSKLSSVITLSENSPAAASKLMKKISESIKSNEAARNMQVPNAPIRQLKSSPNPLDSGPKTVADYRKIYF